MSQYDEKQRGERFEWTKTFVYYKIIKCTNVLEKDKARNLNSQGINEQPNRDSSNYEFIQVKEEGSSLEDVSFLC